MRQSNSATRFVATSAKILLFALTIGMFQLAISSGPASALTQIAVPTGLSQSGATHTSVTIAFTSDTTTATSFTASVEDCPRRWLCCRAESACVGVVRQHDAERYRHGHDKN